MIVACDGAARGNPGPAGIGVRITAPGGRVLAEIARGIGVATNNVAEYTALVEGLKRAAEIGATDVLVRSDSHLLVEQLSGRYRVKNPTLQRLHHDVRRLADGFRRIRYEHLPRERNKEADRLANRGVDEWLASEGARWEPRGSAPRLWGSEPHGG
ncbi:MAG: ribonuclease HI family protein [Actinobacteria bacterium]|nr:ribonuclease HI family protein [Actinomycetota bacterium]